MNQAHFHLLVNHIPILFPIAGLVILLGGYLFKSEIVKRSGYVLFIIGAIFTIPSFASGEGAEEIVEEIGGVSHRTIHEHEETAELFAILSYLLGVSALLALWSNWKKKGFAKIVGIAVLILSLVVVYFGRATGSTGGEIRHTEFNGVQNSNENSNDEEDDEYEEDGEEEDDEELEEED